MNFGFLRIPALISKDQKENINCKNKKKIENLRREIKADIRKQHDLYANNLVGGVKANPRTLLPGKIPKIFPH